MLKKVWLITALVLGIFVCNAGAAGFSLGVKSWYNEFEITDDQTGRTTSYDAAWMAGPSLKFSLGKFFLSGTYMESLTDYERNDGITLERKDYDANVGFLFYKGYGVVLGYKEMQREIPYPTYTWYSDLTGWVVGLVGSQQLGSSPISIYGNVGYLMLEDETHVEFKSGTQTTPFTDDNTGWSGELGVAASLLNNHLGLALGYKYQALEAEIGNATRSYQGVTASVDMRF